MPQIKEYFQRSDVQGPMQGRRATGEDVGVGAGLTALGRGVAAYTDAVAKRTEQAEVSDLHAKVSQAQLEWTKHYEEQLQAGTLDTGKFVENLDEYASKMGEGLQTAAGQDYLGKATAQLRTHFAEKAILGQAQLAGAKARADYQTSVNNYSSTLVNDPSSFGAIKAMHDTGITELVQRAGLPAAQAMELMTHGHRELAKSAVHGWVQLDPQEAKKKLAGGEFNNYIDGDTKKQLFAEAEQAVRGRELEDERLRREQERVRKEQQEVTQNTFLQKMVDGKLSASDILKSNLEAFGSGSKEQFLQIMKKSQDDRIRTDPGTFTDLFHRIHAPDNDPKKILDESYLNQFVGNGLTIETLNQLRSEIQGRKTIDGQMVGEMKKQLMEVARGKLSKANPMLGIPDPEGQEKMLRFTSYFLTEFDKQVKAGKKPFDLLHPDNPDYLGKGISMFAESPTEIVRKSAQAFRSSLQPVPTPSTSPTGAPLPAPGAKPARLPGESASDYLKRVGQ